MTEPRRPLLGPVRIAFAWALFDRKRATLAELAGDVYGASSRATRQRAWTTLDRLRADGYARLRSGRWRWSGPREGPPPRPGRVARRPLLPHDL